MGKLNLKQFYFPGSAFGKVGKWESNVATQITRANAGKRESGKVGKWESGKAGKWESGKVKPKKYACKIEKWESGKAGKWESGKVGK